MINEELRKKVVDAGQVCQECGLAYGSGFSNGQRQATLSTWHIDTCDICGQEKPVTEFRDFGYAKREFLPSNYEPENSNTEI